MDDIASSGRTMLRVLERQIAAGTRPPVCVIIHAVFADNAYEDILAVGAARVVTTDGIPHESNAISLAKAIKHACLLWLKDQRDRHETPDGTADGG